jgi:hypothetical protein
MIAEESHLIEQQLAGGMPNMNHAIEAAPNKHCEQCGERSPDSRYVFVAESSHLIFLQSPHVRYHDLNTRTVTISTGQHIHYDLAVGPMAFVLKACFVPHILCSEKCATELCKQRVFFGPEVLQKTAVIDCTVKGSEIWDATVLPVSSMRRYETGTCSQCGRSFPNISKKFSMFGVVDVRMVNSDHGEPTAPPGFDYDFVQSDTNHVSPSGHWWFFKMTEERDTAHEFCSDECCCQYAATNNVIVLFPNIVLQGTMAVVTPVTMQVNKGLRNSYLFRPQKGMPL